jgi:hypothetical protein
VVKWRVTALLTISIVDDGRRTRRIEEERRKQIMRLIGATSLATIAAASVAVAVVAAAAASAEKSVDQYSDDDSEIKKELRHLASLMSEITSKQSSFPSSSDAALLPPSIDEVDVTKWMERKEEEVGRYYTLLNRGSTMSRSPSLAESSSGQEEQRFLQMDGSVILGRRRLRVVEQQPDEEQLQPVSSNNDQEGKGERELGAAVGMKRTDPQVTTKGRFQPMSSMERKPPGGRERSSGGVDGGGKIKAPQQSGGESMASLSSGSSVVQTSVSLSTSPQKIGDSREPWDDASAIVRTKPQSIKRTQEQLQQQTLSYNYEIRMSSKSIKPPPEPYYIFKEVEEEDCYDVEELEALGIDPWESPATDIWRWDDDDEEVVEEEEDQEESTSLVRRWDGIILNRKPGSSGRRTLQRTLQDQYTYWYWSGGAKAEKSSSAAKSLKAAPPPKTGTIAPPPKTPLPPPPPPHPKSKSGKSKAGKVTKSGKACIDKGNTTTVLLENVCGLDLADAESKCNSTCIIDSDCPALETCFLNVQCSGGENRLGYCGSDAEDASTQCVVPCSGDADCQSGQSCFSEDDVVEQCSKVPIISGYCGSDLVDASKCDDTCYSDGDCPSGESCFSLSDIGACSKPETGFCGKNLEDAAKCAVPCESDEDCPKKESCFTDVAECKPGYCGTDLDDASSCAVPCSSDAGCPSGQSCFTDAACVVEKTCPTGCKDCDPDSPLPCPNPMMKQVCDKQNNELYPPGDPKAGQRISNFKDCYDMCKPSFCCIHASASKKIAPSCSKEYENCPLYYPCYIIWWKLHDTIGPATYLRVEQKEPFFNVKLDQLNKDFTKDPAFFNQLFGHHFDTDDPLQDDTFENPENW